MSFFVYTPLAWYKSHRSINPILFPMQIASINDILHPYLELTSEENEKALFVSMSTSLSNRASIFSKNETYQEHWHSIVAHHVIPVVANCMLQQLHYLQLPVAVVLKCQAKLDVERVLVANSMQLSPTISLKLRINRRHHSFSLPMKQNRRWRSRMQMVLFTFLQNSQGSAFVAFKMCTLF